MVRGSRSIITAALSTLAVCGFVQRAGAASYSESVDGDLSGTPAAPTAWTLDVGANNLTGRAGLIAGTSDYDYDLVAITIPAARQLNSIELTHYENVDPFGFGFIGIQVGSPWLDTVGPAVSGAFLMGYTHIEPVLEGGDVLSKMQEHSADPPFPIPLGPGTYSLLIQDIELAYDYTMTFNVSGVPEPSSAALLALGGIMGWRCRQRLGMRGVR